MNVRRFVIAGISAAVLIVAGAIVLNVLPTPGHGSDSAGPGAQSSQGSNASGSSGSDGSTLAGATPGPARTPGKRLTTEVLPPTATATVPALPPSKPIPALFTGPMPKTASAKGKLVAGFPSHLPVVAESDIKDSSVSSSDGRLQATLDATSSRTPDEVIAYYQSALGKYGLSSTSLPAVGGSTALAFSHGSTSITLTVTPAGKHGSRYVLFGALSPDS